MFVGFRIRKTDDGLATQEDNIDKLNGILEVASDQVESTPFSRHCDITSNDNPLIDIALHQLILGSVLFYALTLRPVSVHTEKICSVDIEVNQRKHSSVKEGFNIVEVYRDINLELREVSCANNINLEILRMRASRTKTTNAVLGDTCFTCGAE